MKNIVVIGGGYGGLRAIEEVAITQLYSYDIKTKLNNSYFKRNF